jgi:peptide deformylase
VEATDAETEEFKDISIPLVYRNNPILREEMPRFDFSNPPQDPIEIAHILAQTMIKNVGLGLSCSQIGLPYRAFAVKASPILVCFNPVIVDISDEEVYLEEGCLTFPNLFIKIKRPEVIRMRWTQPNGETVTENYEGMTARVMQHELDHLDGILYMDRATDYHYEQARNRKKKYDRQARRKK